jgi:hypothetical protein
MLAIMGDSISYMNGILVGLSNKDVIYYKEQIFNEIVSLKNIKGFVYSYYSLYLLIQPEFNKSLKLKLYKSNYVTNNLPSQILYKFNISTNNKINRQDFEPIKYKYIIKNKKIISYDYSILNGIRLGLNFKKKSTFSDSNDTTKYKDEFIHHVQVILALIINNLLYHDNDFYQTLLDVNKVLLEISQSKKKNKVITKISNDFNKYIKNVLQNDKVSVIRNLKFKKLNPLTTLLIGINSFLSYPDDIINLIKYSGIIEQRNPASCAIACSFYGITHGLKNVPSKMYKNIENYDLIEKNVFNSFLI